MTRDEVLSRLRVSRAAFDSRVLAIPVDAFETVPPGFRHSAKDTIAHVSAYERLVVDRLHAARRGEQTAFDRDRDSWEAFNARIWREAESLSPADVLSDSSAVFSELVDEVSCLTDEELNSTVGVTAAIDPTWLDGHSLWELIGIDCFDHYPMHFDLLEAAAGSTRPHTGELA